MPEQKADKKKVFISYGHDDCKDLAFKFYDELWENDYDPWIDEHKLKVGQDWMEYMENGLKESDSVLVLITPYSMRRPNGYCLNELSFANTLGKTIIPIMVRYITPPLSINRIQYLNFQEWRCSDEIFNSKFQKILEVVDGRKLEFEGGYSYLLKKLKPIDFGAEIDKHIRRFFGREWIFQEVKNWLYGKEGKESKIFLLKGDPGIGKTAIASKLCREFSEVAAYHLIEFGNPTKSDAKECVLSLAYQLSNQIPDLVNSLRADGLKILEKENALSLFDRLIVQPLRNISEPEEPKLIVIDALDEAKKEKKSGKGMENEMLDFIAKIFELTPKWLKLFITSRPEQYILNKLDELESFSLNTKDERNNEDLRGFLKEELNKIFPNTPIDTAIDTIVERSEGIFLYIIKIIEDLGRDPAQGILKIQNPEKFPKGLTKWYLQNFERQFPDEEYYDKNLIPFLELIVAAQEPLKLPLIKDILGWDKYQLNKAMQALGTLFKITPDEEIEPFHKTLVEWLIDEKATQSVDRSFNIEKNDGAKKLASYGWLLYKQDPSQLPFYFFRHLAHHLLEADNIDELNNLKTEINIETEKTEISEISSQFITHLTQHFKEINRDDILKEFLLYSKKVSCPECKGIKIKYKKSINLYECLNQECGLQFDTEIHAKFKKIFLSYSPDENLLDLIERVKHDLKEDFYSIEKSWEDAQVVLIFLSPQSIIDKNCLLDVNNARSKDKKIISILIEDCIPPKEFNLPRIIPLDFKNWPFTDLDYKGKLNQLKDKIEEEILISEAKRNRLNNIYISFNSSAQYKIFEELSDNFKTLSVNTVISDGIMSQEACISYLKKSDLVIFFIFPYYGHLIEICHLKEQCSAECPMKTGEGRISYTHCEYKTTKAEGIRHMTFLIKEGWKEIWELKDVPENEINLSELKKNPFFQKMDDMLIKHYIEIRKEACIFNEEIDEEYRKEIRNIEDPDIRIRIVELIVDNILFWYFSGRIDLPYFSGRREELEVLIEWIDSKVEVYGVGGVGKTTLVQVALIFQILKGRKVLCIGAPSYYASGSGYMPFRRKFDTMSPNKITLYDVIDAFDTFRLLPKAEKVRKLPKDQQIEILAEVIRKYYLILFIDDFHLADKDVVDLVKKMDRVILASRKNTHLVEKEIYLGGIRDLDSENLLELIKPRSLVIPNSDRDKILQISEGHPITLEFLVRNYEYINLDKLEEFNIKNIDDTEVRNYSERLIQDIGSSKAFDLLKDLSVINSTIDTNINRESVESSYDILETSTLFDELVDAGMLTKKEGKEVEYDFTFKYIHIALKSLANQASHQKAVQYYKNKKEKIGKSVDDSIEILFHLFKSNPSEDILHKYVKLAKKISPKKNSFKRLIDIGEQIKDSFQPDDVFRNENKATIFITLGHLYNKLERFQKAERSYKEALDYIGDIDNLIGENMKQLLSTDNNSFLNLFDEFVGYYMVYVSTRKVIELSPWKELSSRLSKIIEDSTNDEIRNKISRIFQFFVNMIAFKQKKLYFFEAYELVHILVAEKPKVDEISNACALYDQLRWMASIVKEDDKDLSLKTAKLYEEYANVFDEVKQKKSIKELKRMRPYIEILESIAWYYQLGEEYIKSAEKYIEIYELEFDRLSLSMHKFILWMAALNFSRGDGLVQSTEHYINLAKLLVETQQISELAVDLYQKVISQLDKSSNLYGEIKERYQEVKEKFNIQKKSCKYSEVKALLISNIYDKIAADIVGSFLYSNNINCYFETNIKTKDELLENNDRYDYIILIGGPFTPATGHLAVEIFGDEKDFPKLFQTQYSYSNVWTRNIDDTNTRWILIAGNGVDSTLEAVDMFKKSNYLKEGTKINNTSN